jgi:hypothetical protein
MLLATGVLAGAPPVGAVSPPAEASPKPTLGEDPGLTPVGPVAPPATAPGSTQIPDLAPGLESQIEAVAEGYLAPINDALAEGGKSRRVPGSASPEMARRADARAAQEHERRERLRQRGSTFSSVSTTVAVHGAQVGDDGRIVASVTETVVRVYRRSTGEEPPAWVETIDHVASLRRHPDGSLELEAIDAPTLGAPDLDSPPTKPQAMHPTRANDARPKGAASVPAGSKAGADARTGLSVSEAVAYARKYALHPNPDYVEFDNDCTNFLSQVMKSYGWADVEEDSWWPLHNREDRNWYYNVRGVFHEYSWTWGGADNFQRFSRDESGRSYALSNIWDTLLADFIQIDWGPRPDGNLNHSVVVTGINSQNGERYISYHSTNTKDRPLSDFVDQVRHDHAGSWWYADRT